MSLQCGNVSGLPFGGAEILVLAAFFLFLAVIYCVTFVDLAAKQWWPSFLDPAVAARVKQIQQQFPELQKGAKSPEDGVKSASDMPNYTHVVSQESYISGRSVDDDLVFMLANNGAFSTVSSYCASTVRGYALLSNVLYVAGITLGFLWVHNATINPSGGDFAGKASLVGYLLCFLTSTVMTNPNNQAVKRNANIALWSNIPLRLGGKGNPMLKLHDIGIVGFVALPLFAHLYVIYTTGSSMPNYAGAITGVSWQLIGAVCFWLSGFLDGKGLTHVQSNKCQIMAEVVVVFASFLAYLQWEFYNTAACANAVTAFHSLMLAAASLPFMFCARHYWCAPTTFPAAPSVMLMDGDTPVATAGPAPCLVFDEESTALPHFTMQE